MKNTDQVNEAKTPSGQAVESLVSQEQGVQPEDEEDEGCTIQVDLGQSCGKPVTRVVHEPYTPASFKVECCEEHAESLIQFGYLKGK